MPRRSRDPLIVGSGIAGLYVALRCHEEGLRPTVITKSSVEESNTRYAQGGIAAAVGAGDSPRIHERDTIRAGDGLVDPDAARILAEEAPLRIADLVRYGVPFDTVNGQVALGREAAHSRDRILHAGGDATGLQIEETLKRRVLDAGIAIRERTVLRRLTPDRRGHPIALLGAAVGGGAEEVDASAVVLATGGAGALYRESSNPSIATGEGVAIAARAGALVSDMEFIQFHPTAFYRPGAPRFLITEAIRGEGAVIRDGDGRRFLPTYHPDAELAARDVVARAIHTELARSGDPCVFLDATAIPRDRLFARFPTICRMLDGYALDPSRDRIPVTPVAHYMIGGVTSDLEGRSTVPGLLVCGEVAATGVHGANRLASNSLLEGLVFGERVARQLLHPSPGGPHPPRRVEQLAWPPGSGDGGAPDAGRGIAERLWEDVGIVRDARGLGRAERDFAALGRHVEPPDGGTAPSPLANAALVAALVARAAALRTESRGAHYRADYPRRRSPWRLHLGLRLPA
ncbi:MAG: L-aspartate oxidase [Thermoplasmata archaeon]|nr:L-aspartate oxidase [Thermoplasmata archaeon]